VRPLLVPVTVTEYEPTGPEHDNVEVALELELLRESTEGTALQVRPVKGETVAERATFPTKPSKPFAIIVVEPVAPARDVTLVGVTVSPKSSIAYVTCTNALLAPLVAVTVTV
jgi:hypothetical protein